MGLIHRRVIVPNVEIQVEGVEAALRILLQRRLKPRGYREFDRTLGRPESGWTSKFLRGERSLTLELLFVVLHALDVHPAEFFLEFFPQGESETDAAVREYMATFEDDMRRIAREVYKDLREREE
jgi:hypothetical protein